MPEAMTEQVQIRMTPSMRRAVKEEAARRNQWESTLLRGFIAWRLHELELERAHQ